MKGSTAQDRRRARRAAARGELSPDDLEAIQALALVASASGSTSLPLSDRAAAWDAGAAAKSLDSADFPKAFFWKDASKPTDQISSYKLGFASKAGGTLTAIFRGVTAAAGAIQGARGGVQIPDADVAGVKKNIAAYYSKAATQYKDDSIKPPWTADKSAGETEAFLLAYAESPGVSRLMPEFEDGVKFFASATEPEGVYSVPAVYARDKESIDAFGERLLFWVEQFGGREILPTSEESLPEELALAKIDAALGLEIGHASVPIVVDGLKLLAPKFEEAARAMWASRAEELAEEEFVERFVLHFIDAIEPPEAGDVNANRGPTAWKAIFVPEATLTDDGRAFAPGAIEWRDLPLSLMAMTKTSAAGGHDGAEISGRIDQIWREGNLILAAGVFDEGEFGAEIARMVADGTLRGLSIDIAIHEAERGPKSDYFDENGDWLTEKPEAPDTAPSPDDLIWGTEADLILVVTKGVIGMATVCPFPAFADANISLAASAANPMVWRYRRPLTLMELRPIDGTPDALVASALAPELIRTSTEELDGIEHREVLTAAAAGMAPLNPPVEWFQDPELEELSPITVDDDGRIYGHAWGWGTCHTGVQGECVTAPHSNTNYAYFHVGEIECENGDVVAVGRLTFDTGHADQRLSRRPALAHYDNTGKIGAFVVVGEDAFGGWVAGSLAAEISEEEAQRLRGSAPSGDWRAVNGNLELIALLAVNVPGFPVPRPRALVAAADGGLAVMSLTAAGVAEVLRERTPEDDFREIGALADQARGDYDELLREARG